MHQQRAETDKAQLAAQDIEEFGPFVETCRTKKIAKASHPASDIGDNIVRDREYLSRDGILLVDLNIDKFTGRLMYDPEIITRGFVSREEAENLIPIVRKKVMSIINGGLDDQKTIINTVRSMLYNETKRKPMVFVTMSKV